jgi:hypothetical protein
MRRLMAMTTAMAVATLASASAARAAQQCEAVLVDRGCLCAVPYTPGDAIGTLTRYAVAIENIDGGHFALADTTKRLRINDRFRVDSDGSTFVTAGSMCQPRQLPPNSTVSVTVIDGCACVAIEGDRAVSGCSDCSAATIAGAVIGAGVGAALAVENNKPVSP